MALSLLLNWLFASKYALQISSKSLQRGNPFWRGFNYFLLVNKDLAAIPLYQRPKAFTHTPTNVAQDLKAVGAGHKEGDAAVAQYADGFGKTVKSLQFEAGHVEALQLFFRKHLR
jgi:hypothetical protein